MGIYPNLDTVPLELLEAIFDCLPSGASLAPTAATCKALAPAAQRHIFGTLHLDSTRRRDEGIALLSASPHLGLYVRTLVLGPLVFEPPAECALPAAWKRGLQDFGSEHEYAAWLEDALDWMDNKDALFVAEDRERWWESGELPWLLGTMPHVLDLKVHGLHWERASAELARALCGFPHLLRLHLHELSCPSVATLGPLLHSCARSLRELEVTSLSLAREAWREDGAEYPYRQFLNVEVLTLNGWIPVPFACWLALCLSRRTLVSFASLCRQSLGSALPIVTLCGASIRDLSLPLYIAGTLERTDEQIQLAQLPRCTALRMLDLALDVPRGDILEWSWLPHILHAISSPFLESLSLECRIIASDHLNIGPALCHVLPILHTPQFASLARLAIAGVSAGGELHTLEDSLTAVGVRNAMDCIPLVVAESMHCFLWETGLERHAACHTRWCHVYDVSSLRGWTESGREERDLLVVATCVQNATRREYVQAMMVMPRFATRRSV